MISATIILPPHSPLLPHSSNPHQHHPQPRPNRRDSGPDQVCGVRRDRLHHRWRWDRWQCPQSCRAHKA